MAAQGVAGRAYSHTEDEGLLRSGRDFSEQGQEEKCPSILGLRKLPREEG